MALNSAKETGIKTGKGESKLFLAVMNCDISYIQKFFKCPYDKLLKDFNKKQQETVFDAFLKSIYLKNPLIKIKLGYLTTFKEKKKNIKEILDNKSSLTRKINKEELKKLLINIIVKQPNAAGETILHLAAKLGSIEVLRCLLKHKELFNIDGLDKNGLSPLHYAVRYATTQNVIGPVSILLEAGADANTQTQVKGLTPIHEAIYRAHYGCVEWLLKSGANPNIRTAVPVVNTDPNHFNFVDQGSTAFHTACGPLPNQTQYMLFSRLRCLSLLGEKYSAGLVDTRGLQAIHYAARHGHLLLIKHLLTFQPFSIPLFVTNPKTNQIELIKSEMLLTTKKQPFTKNVLHNAPKMLNFVTVLEAARKCSAQNSKKMKMMYFLVIHALWLLCKAKEMNIGLYAKVLCKEYNLQIKKLYKCAKKFGYVTENKDELSLKFTKHPIHLQIEALNTTVAPKVEEHTGTSLFTSIVGFFNGLSCLSTDDTRYQLSVIPR